MLPALAFAADGTAVESVTEFYKRYLGPNQDVILQDGQRPQIRLSAAFQQAVEENRRICAANSTGVCGWGADGDEYLDTQETDPYLSYESSGIQIQSLPGDTVQVRLNVYPSETESAAFYTKVITYKMIREGDAWAVDDITYTNGHSARKMIREETEFVRANPDPDAPEAAAAPPR